MEGNEWNEKTAVAIVKCKKKNFTVHIFYKNIKNVQKNEKEFYIT